jgi:2-keto-4-pentenoate hydratase
MDQKTQSILTALDLHAQIDPAGRGAEPVDLRSAYRISDQLLAARIGRGERPIGWKIGFTNRTIWDEYDVHAPIWGPVYDTTVQFSPSESLTPEIDLDRFVEPRIEPEIIFRLGKRPHPDMDDEELFSCVDALVHGFEIVQSIYPDWQFRAPDTVAAFALHGALVCGPLVPTDSASSDIWITSLRSFEIDLSLDGAVVDHGLAQNVLGNPLSAFRHFVAGLHASPMSRGIEIGDLISTGTLTRALPIEAGELWSTRLSGLPLPDMRMRVGGGHATVERLITEGAKAAFHVETPASCADADAYERAMAKLTTVETALARLLQGDHDALVAARNRMHNQAVTHAREWKTRPAP